MTENQSSHDWDKLAGKLEHPRTEEPSSPEEAAFFDIREAAEGWQEIALLNTTTAWQEVAARIQHTHKKTHAINWFRVAAAAVVTGLIAGGAVFLLKSPRQKTTTTVAAHAADNQQIQLITGSGATVVPDSGTQLKEADGTRISAGKTAISYEAVQTAQQLVFNTLVVPRGHTYKVVLSDGTRVWLNADSRLRFPVAFSGDSREVELEGEACFETTPAGGKPFLVKTGDIQVTVLATEFNINAYTPNTFTTLVSGKVKVGAGTLAKELTPGQQAIYRQGTMTVANVDAEQFTAWKEGLLVFDNTSLGDIMTRLGREYDYTVNFEHASLQQRRLGGNIEKSPNISQVLELLEELTDVHFVIDQPKRTIMVKQGK
ncbi:FecR family protein [Chitinophaga qingshengii]|uniref:FecR domain-containing protein n=1 Tax=Chitinophaga qingshengii TaxID=1569794 RepID=A0ABR7TR24_9BACT|nr:FecR domain-containing protein [Chitinophaga qingshengii]MBC9931946.1 FecR domain-containing protein [Chitinophaga qingshengii]